MGTYNKAESIKLKKTGLRGVRTGKGLRKNLMELRDRNMLKKIIYTENEKIYKSLNIFYGVYGQIVF